MSRQYWILPRLHVSGANALPAWWFAGPPSPTAYVGFGQAMALKCAQDNGRGFVGVGAVVHDFRFRAERIGNDPKLYPHQFRAATYIDASDYTSKNKYALSLQPVVRADLVVSLIVAFDGDAVVDADAVRAFLDNARVAGGIVEDAQGQMALEDSMEGVLRTVRQGFALHERSDLLAQGARLPGEDQLGALLRLTRNTQENRETHSWLMPATLGHQVVSPVAKRRWSRDEHPHAYAEPLVSLVQLKSLHDDPIVPIWRYGRLGAAHIVTTQDPNATSM